MKEKKCVDCIYFVEEKWEIEEKFEEHKIRKAKFVPSRCARFPTHVICSSNDWCGEYEQNI